MRMAGRPAFAEQMVLHLLEREGWDAVWVDGFRNMHRVGYADEEAVGLVPDRVQAVLRRIEALAGHWGGCHWPGAQPLIGVSEVHGRLVQERGHEIAGAAPDRQRRRSRRPKPAAREHAFVRAGEAAAPAVARV